MGRQVFVKYFQRSIILFFPEEIALTNTAILREELNGAKEPIDQSIQ